MQLKEKTHHLYYLVKCKVATCVIYGLVSVHIYTNVLLRFHKKKVFLIVNFNSNVSRLNGCPDRYLKLFLKFVLIKQKRYKFTKKNKFLLLLSMQRVQHCNKILSLNLKIKTLVHKRKKQLLHLSKTNAEDMILKKILHVHKAF